MQTSIGAAMMVGLAALVGSGALASGLGWLAQAACAWCGIGA